MHFRESMVWQQSMELVREVYRLMPYLPVEETEGMRQHLIHVAILVPSHVAEGWAGEVGREKMRSLDIARGALARMETLVILCENMGWLSSHETSHLWELISETSRRLTTLRQNFRHQD